LQHLNPSFGQAFLVGQSFVFVGGGGDREEK